MNKNLLLFALHLIKAECSKHNRCHDGCPFCKEENCQIQSIPPEYWDILEEEPCEENHMKYDLQDVCDRLERLTRSLEHRSIRNEYVMTQKDIDKLKERNEILEKRCERFREIIRNEVSMVKLDDYFNSDVMAVNDIRYLCELTELSESETKQLIKPKPPLGVMPRDMWDQKRQEELADAMVRYLEAGKKIPSEWLKEYNEISERWEEKNE